MKDENLHKEIDLIQSAISRMAKNSFLLKGWAISIIAVVLALTDDKTNPIFLIFVVFIPLLCFWYLDTFFLHTEKMYRKMYEWVLTERPKGNDEFQYDLNPRRFKKEGGSFICTMFSKTLGVFYGVPSLIIIAIVLYQFCTSLCCC